MDNYVKIEVLDNEIEAQIVDDILTEQKIPFLIRSFHDEAYGTLFQTSKGWGRIYAPKEYEQEIKDILAEIRKGVDIENLD